MTPATFAAMGASFAAFGAVCGDGVIRAGTAEQEAVARLLAVTGGEPAALQCLLDEARRRADLFAGARGGDQAPFMAGVESVADDVAAGRLPWISAETP